METTQLAHARSGNDTEANASTLARLIEWVKIPTHQSEPSNILKLQKTIALELIELGFEIDFIHSHGLALLVAQTSCAKNSEHAITLLGHVDTALATPPTVRFENDWAYANGIGDNKGGLMVGLRALEKLGYENINKLPIRFIISPNEESGSNGFHQIFEQFAKKTDWVLGLEPALANGNIIDGRCGNRWYQIDFNGVGAHAGRFNEPHANPLHAIAKLTNKLIPLNDDHSKRRVNITDIKVSPGIINAIPSHAQLKIDTRFATTFDQKLIDTIISEELVNQSVICPITNTPVKSKIEILDDCPPLERKGPNWFYQAALAAINSEEEKTIHCQHTGGASDANHFFQARKGVLDGLGPIARGMHTDNEAILISSLETRSCALSKLIHTLGETYA